MGALLFSQLRVMNVKLINDRNSLNISLNVRKTLKINTTLRFLRTSYNSIWASPGILKSRVGMDVPAADGNLSYLCLRATFPLVPEIIKFKLFEM